MEPETAEIARYLTGRLAAAAGVGADTVRFYEKQGLLAKPPRSPSGYRLYGESAVRRLRFIRKAQALGFSLGEIKRILRLRANGSACRCVMAMAAASLEETEQKLAELERLRGMLKANLENWKKHPQDGDRMAAEFCGLIESAVQNEPPERAAALDPGAAPKRTVARLPTPGSETRTRRSPTK
jgi:DNA-binding transcriptional MerR regulator